MNDLATNLFPALSSVMLVLLSIASVLITIWAIPFALKRIGSITQSSTIESSEREFGGNYYNRQWARDSSTNEQYTPEEKAQKYADRMQDDLEHRRNARDMNWY